MGTEYIVYSIPLPTLTAGLEKYGNAYLNGGSGSYLADVYDKLFSTGFHKSLMSQFVETAKFLDEQGATDASSLAFVEFVSHFSHYYLDGKYFYSDMPDLDSCAGYIAVYFPESVEREVKLIEQFELPGIIDSRAKFEASQKSHYDWLLVRLNEILPKTCDVWLNARDNGNAVFTTCF